MAEEPTFAYGRASNLFVNRKAGGDSIVVGGTAEDASRWTRVLSQRAAQMLWYHLTRMLFPEKSDAVTALVSTAPLRSEARPTVTTHVVVERTEDGDYEVMGWVGDQNWWLRLTEAEARPFWSALDVALYPVGWEGRSSRPPH